MKRLQQLSVKTKVFDRRKTFITHTALNVETSGKASTSVGNTYSEEECANSNNIDVEADDCEMSLCGVHQARGDEDSANTNTMRGNFRSKIFNVMILVDGGYL